MFQEVLSAFLNGLSLHHQVLVLHPENPVKLFSITFAAEHWGAQWPSTSFGKGKYSACSTTDGCRDRAERSAYGSTVIRARGQ